MVKKWLDAYFGLSKREFNGLLVLVALIFLVSLAPYLFVWFNAGGDADPVDEEMVTAVVDEFSSRNTDTGLFYGYDNRPHQVSEKKRARLFMFDPNLISSADWQLLGLSERQALAILRYRSRGGRFNKKTDLQKMYTVSPALYKRLEPYIDIRGTGGGPRDVRSFVQSQERSFIKVAGVIEINGADSARLCEVRGIGPVFASRIIKYRARLGGFYSVLQLMEVFGLDSLKYGGIASQVKVDAALVNKININLAGFEELKGHPYLRYKQINALIQYRKQHGNYSNIADLNRVFILDTGTIARVAPYLTF